MQKSLVAHILLVKGKTASANIAKCAMPGNDYSPALVLYTGWITQTISAVETMLPIGLQALGHSSDVSCLTEVVYIPTILEASAVKF